VGRSLSFARHADEGVENVNFAAGEVSGLWRRVSYMSDCAAEHHDHHVPDSDLHHPSLDILFSVAFT
jgi:hypothetical protein